MSQVLPFVKPFLVVLTPEESDARAEKMVKAEEIRWSLRGAGA